MALAAEAAPKGDSVEALSVRANVSGLGLTVSVGAQRPIHPEKRALSAHAAASRSCHGPTAHCTYALLLLERCQVHRLKRACDGT